MGEPLIPYEIRTATTRYCEAHRAARTILPDDAPRGEVIAVAAAILRSADLQDLKMNGGRR